MANILKESYEKIVEYTAFYTGGDIQWSVEGTHFVCQCNSVINVIDINTCSTVNVIGQAEEDLESDSMYTFKMSHDSSSVVSAHKSGLLKLWDRETGKLMKMWRSGHKGPVAKLAFDYLNENIASGGSDGNVRLWDLNHNTCTSSLRGATGVFSILDYHPNSSLNLIFGAADDTKIRSWNCKSGKECLVYSGHFSKITALKFTQDGQYMISSGRDRVLILWKLNESRAVRTVPVYESIESIEILPNTFKIPNFNKKLNMEGIYIACGGEKGIVKIWNIQMSRLMYEQNNSLVSPALEDGGLAISHLMFNEARNLLTVVTADHNIIIHDLETFDCIKQLIGFTDDVLDLILIGKDEMHIVVATNSHDLKYYDLHSMNCQILKGHSDIVLSLACFPTKREMFVSSGKDNQVKIWLQDTNKNVKCIGTGMRHTASVGSVFTSQISTDFFVSVSQDTCLKVWTIPKDLSLPDERIISSHTVVAHQMDINSVTVSPNDKVIATGSQDKTAKLWTEDLSLLGVLKGHRRGVWCVRFSPADQVVATSSADVTIKLWSIVDLSCLKTFEGHESSVLKLEFLSRGQQIISSGADGFLKLWSIKTSECKFSLDNHEGKVWSLAVNSSESLIITGGSDSKIVKLKDSTIENRDKMAKEREMLILQEQELMNLLKDKNMIKALKLSIRLQRPLQALNIINEIIKSGNDKLYDVLKEINEVQKETLLKFAMEWNTNNKNCHSAQIIFHILSPEIISGRLKVPSLSSFIESSLPYSERHFDRLTNLLQDLNFITYTVNCMQPHVLNQQ